MDTTGETPSKAPHSPPDPPLIVPWRELSADALLGVVDEFVLREGTDYGDGANRDISLEAKRREVVEQLEAGSAVVVFDPERQSVDVRLHSDLTFAADGSLVSSQLS